MDEEELRKSCNDGSWDIQVDFPTYFSFIIMFSRVVSHSCSPHGVRFNKIQRLRGGVSTTLVTLSLRDRAPFLFVSLIFTVASREVLLSICLCLFLRRRSRPSCARLPRRPSAHLANVAFIRLVVIVA